jgi:predicted nucleic acid-binding Zn ribbon protein
MNGKLKRRQKAVSVIDFWKILALIMIWEGD